MFHNHNLSVQVLQRRQIAFMANEYLGELQLGGHDASSISEPLFYTKMLNDSGYGVAVSSFKYNGVEVLRWACVHHNFYYMHSTNNDECSSLCECVSLCENIRVHAHVGLGLGTRPRGSSHCKYS